MSGHTKGPWEYSQHKFPNPPFEGTLEDEYGVYPPLGESGPVAITTGENNALLIAAAPELLSELRLILDWAQIERAPLRQKEINRIDDLIKKATHP